jgi:hypothetical protein
MTTRNLRTVDCARTLSIASLLFVLFCSIETIVVRQAAAEEIKTGTSSTLGTSQKADRQSRSSEFIDLSNNVLQLIEATEYTQAL